MLVSIGHKLSVYCIVPTIDISELDSAVLLAALYNRAAPIGYGFLSADPHDLTVEEAEEILLDQHAETNSAIIWDLRGRVIQSSFNPDAPDFTLVDKAHGAGAALSVIRALKSGERIRSRPWIRTQNCQPVRVVADPNGRQCHDSWFRAGGEEGLRKFANEPSEGRGRSLRLCLGCR